MVKRKERTKYLKRILNNILNISKTIRLNYYQSPNSRIIPFAKKALKRYPTMQTSNLTSIPLKISIKTDRITLRPC